MSVIYQVYDTQAKEIVYETQNAQEALLIKERYELKYQTICSIIKYEINL